MAIDVLSDVLRVVRLSGAVFFTAEFSSPWAVESPPAEVMQFIARVGHVRLANQTAVASRLRVDVHDADRVAVSMRPRADERDVRELLRGRLRCEHRRRVECRVRFQQRHWVLLV